MGSTLKIKTKKLMLRAARFDVENVEYTYDDKETYSKQVIRHPGAVVIMPVLDDGRVVFISQPRVAVEVSLFELPAGTMKPGEEPLLCARRELAEEAAIAATDWISMGEIFPAPGICDERQFLFAAKGLSPCRLEPDPEERISVHHFGKSQILKMIDAGEIRDSKTLALLFKASLRGLW